MKYIIEIEDSPMFAANGDMLWRAKDFKSLVFDSDGLAKLQPYYWDKWNLICDAKLPGMRADKSKSAENPLLNNSKDSVHTRLDNRLKESAQTKSDPEEYKKAVIEAVKKLANAPVDKTVNKSEESKKSEEVKKPEKPKKPGETKKTISPDTWETLTERYRKALGRLDRTLKFDDTLDDLTSVVNYFLEIFGD